MQEEVSDELPDFDVGLDYGFGPASQPASPPSRRSAALRHVQLHR